MTAADDGDRLFELVPSLAEVEGRLTSYRERREALLAEVRTCDERLARLGALLHGLREFAGNWTATVTVVRLVEGGWSGTGEQLVATVRAVLHERPVGAAAQLCAGQCTRAAPNGATPPEANGPS